MRSPSGIAVAMTRGRGAGGDEHDVGLRAPRSRRRRSRRAPVPARRTRPAAAAPARRSASSRVWMSWLCAAARPSTRALTALQVGRRRPRPRRPRRPRGARPCRRRSRTGHEVGRGDEGLAGHAVGEDGRATDAVALDDGDLGAELGGDEGCLVATGATTEDDDGRMAVAHARYPTTRCPRAPIRGRPSTRRTARLRSCRTMMLCPCPGRRPQGIACGGRAPGDPHDHWRFA